MDVPLQFAGETLTHHVAHDAKLLRINLAPPYFPITNQ
jgi:hypothetical protein